MATIKQINANRKNALLSKGPKSDLGKLKSSKNSLKHGLTAKQLVIGESFKEFEKYRDRMIDELKPEGILEEETVFVDRLISFMSTVNKDVVVIGDNSWIQSDKLNIESLMKLKVRIPISNYFDFTSLENRYLLDKFESKYNHKMDRFSLLSFKSILHFCSDIPQFNFVQLNENSGFINSDVRLYEYSDYQLIPVE